jgi:hypothetical protein
VVCFILAIPSVSALDFDNVRSYDKSTETIRINNAFGLPLIGDVLATHKLTDNTDVCLTNCYAEGISDLRYDQVLFQEVEFENKIGDTKEINDFKYFIRMTETEDGERNTYTTTCEDITVPKIVNRKNITAEYIYESCTQEVTGTEEYEIISYDWKRYKGAVLDKGIYHWRIEGRKNAYEDVDWIVTSNGERLTEWAWWNSSWEYSRTISDLTGDISGLYTIPLDDDMNWDFSALKTPVSSRKLSYVYESLHAYKIQLLMLYNI